jgi:hypothetical protein
MNQGKEKERLENLITKSKTTMKYQKLARKIITTKQIQVFRGS